MQTVEEAFAELATITGLSVDDWRDFLAATPEQQALMVQAYRDQDWARNPDRFGQVIGILSVVGTVAGVVSGVAGAASAIAALKGIA